jgi:hypothetical protein
LVTSSFSLGNKIVVFVNNDLNSTDSNTLQALLNSELIKYKQGFSEAIFMNNNSDTSRCFYLQ